MDGKLGDEAVFWLNEILYWGERLETYSADLTIGEFSSDSIKLDAFCWCISCIGEASAKLLNADTGLQASRDMSLQLRKANAARNRYVHGYFDLESAVVWETATVAVPAMMVMLRAYYQIKEG
jgi:uncharacterized protein with HEPN domain